MGAQLLRSAPAATLFLSLCELSKLPGRRDCADSYNLAAGKDIYQLTLPTHVNEPLTMLQRRAEAFQSSELLDQVHLFLYFASGLSLTIGSTVERQ